MFVVQSRQEIKAQGGKLHHLPAVKAGTDRETSLTWACVCASVNAGNGLLQFCCLAVAGYVYLFGREAPLQLVRLFSWRPLGPA
jgi:hypothetical protein